MTSELIVRNARLRHRDGLVDIVVRDGRIATIMPANVGTAGGGLDAAGGLVTPSFVNPHLHLCKVWTLPMMSEEALKAYQNDGMVNALSAIDLASAVKAKYDASWIIPNARRAVALAALYGTTHLRAFADVDGKARLEGLKALLAVRDEFKGVVDLQVVAFAQDGILKEPGADSLMREAIRLGADVVGGIPWIEKSTADAQAHIAFCFDLAAAFDKDVSMLLDDAGDPSLRTLEMMVAETVKRGWQGRVVAHHCRAMALYQRSYLDSLIDAVREAKVAVVTDPHTGPLHARVPELLAGGVTVCLGQDDISDAYYPFGRNNMLEVGFLAAHLLWMTARSQIETVYDMITEAPARTMNVADYGLEAGQIANLVVLDQPDVVEALRFHAAPRAVISHGRLIDQATMRRVAFGKADG